MSLACREFRGEISVFCGECHNGSTITGSSGGEIGKCVYYVLMVDGRIGGLEASAGTGDFGLPPFLMGIRKENIEVVTSLVGRVLVAPGLTVVKEQTSLKHKLVGNGKNL